MKITKNIVSKYFYYKIRIKVFFLKLFEMFIWTINTYNLKKKIKEKKKSIVFVELATSLTTIKVNCLLATALKKKFKIIVILNHYSPFYEYFYKKVGISNFIYLDQSLDKTKNKKVSILLEKLKSTRNFLNFSFEQIRIGKFIASRILREEQTGNFDLKKIKNEKITNYFFNSIAKIENFKKIINKLNIQFLIFNERGYTPSGEIFELALKNNIKCIQWFGSPIDKFHSLKCYDWSMRQHHPLKLSKSTLKILLLADKKKEISTKIMSHLKDQYYSQKGFNRQNLQKNKIILNKSQLKKKLKIFNNKKICCVFTHILDDATFFYGTSLFSSYESWLRHTLLEANKNEKINWIIKIHPANMLRSNFSLEEKLINEIFKKIPKNIRIVKPDSVINTFSFFQNIDFALTVRGTVGCELACYGVPVITAGTGRYSHQGFTVDPKSKKEFLNILSNLNSIKKLTSKQIKLARIYTYGSLIARSIKMDGIKIDYDYNGISLEKSNVVDIPKSYNDFLKKSDVKKILNWIDKNAADELLEI